MTESAASKKSLVFVLFVETSDQYGTSEPIGIFSTREKADEGNKQIRRQRSYVKEFELDALDAESFRSYVLR